MEIHELANVIPNMSDEEYQALKTDIQENGLLEPIVTFENKILDGRNRYRACLELNIEPRYKEYKGNSPLGYVLFLNIKRRHLTPSQLACIAADILPLLKEEAKKRMTSGINQYSPMQKITEAEKGRSIDKASERIKVNPEYIRQAEKIKKESPDIYEEVRQGIKTLSEVQKDKKREIAQKKIEMLKKKGVSLPKGKYATLVVDPPWPMEKIERKVRPKQVPISPTIPKIFFDKSIISQLKNQMELLVEVLVNKPIDPDYALEVISYES